MTNRQQLEKFHQQLIAIELAGFCIRSQLLPSTEEPRAHGQSEASILKTRLEQLVSEVGERHGSELMQLLSAQSAMTRTYISSFQHWLDNQEKIASLEHLLSEDELRFHAKQGLSCTWLHLVIFAILGVLALSTVWGLSLYGIQGLVEQLRVNPPWALKSLLTIQPYFGWILAGLVVGLLIVGWLVSRRVNFGRSQGDALQALYHAQLAGQRITQLRTSQAADTGEATFESSSPSTSDSPLLRWAVDVAPKQGLDAKNVLGLTQRLYLWMSHDRCQRASISGPRLASAVVGGAIALSAGLLLFYPLIQLLQIVIDTSGLSR
jgi:uncharacterized membrane protein